MHDTQTKEYLKSARRQQRLAEYTVELRAWLEANRSKWAGWPTHFNELDLDETRDRHVRMLKMGCPTCRELGRSRVVRSMQEITTELRRARRREYSKVVTALAV